MALARQRRHLAVLPGQWCLHHTWHCRPEAGQVTTMHTKYLFALLLTAWLNPAANGQSPPPYTFGFIPASISEVDVSFPLVKKWHLEGEVDVQLVTQGSYDTKNPFANVQRFVLRPWISYTGWKHAKLWLGYARNKKYAIQEAGNYETLERRLIVMGSFSQKMPKSSLFQQVRFETKFFDDRNGEQQVIPRLRARIGFNHFLRQHKTDAFLKAPNVSYYMELMLKFADKDYAPDRFDIFRQSVYYSAGVSPRVHLLAGVIAQMQLRTNGTQFDIYYGPIFSVRYSFTPRERETFDNVDGGAD